jgi:hypothetical protein
VPPLPPELGFSCHHASTALEGALRGAAQLKHATGNYWLALSQASICREEARWLALANRRRFVSDQISLREWRETDRQRRIAERRYANEAVRPAVYEVYRLKPSQLDRSTGAIAWPKVLLAPAYDEERNLLDALFRKEANVGLNFSGNAVGVARYVRRLSENLRRNRASMTRADYFAAEKFLCGVKHEAEFPLAGADSQLPRITEGTLVNL